MQFTAAMLVSAAALTASALPKTTPVSACAPFGVVAIQSGSPIHNSALQAVHRGLVVGANSQNATCETETNSATFVIKDEEMFLYAKPLTPQKFFVDRSGMGMGIVGYVTGEDASLGRNWETKGWAIDENNELKFAGTGLQACPNAIDGAWSIWLQGVATPGWLENCTYISNLAVKADPAISCVYTT